MRLWGVPLHGVGFTREVQVADDDTSFLAEAAAIADEYLARVNPDVPLAHVFVPDCDAYRFFQNVPGGAAVMVGRDKSVLFALSTVPSATHEQQFREGRRSGPAEFDL